MEKANASPEGAHEVSESRETSGATQEAARASEPQPEERSSHGPSQGNVLGDDALLDISLLDKALSDSALLEQVLLDEPDQRDALYADPAPHVQMVDHLSRLQREYQQLRAMLDKMRARISRREAHVRQRLRDVLAMADPVAPASPLDRAAQARRAAPARVLYVQAMGPFTVSCGEESVSLGSNKNGRAIFRYLVTRPERRVAKDALLALCWPDDPPQAANHKLHISISSLRKALDGALGWEEEGGSILFVDDQYLLSPNLHVELDADAFVWRVRAGERLEGQGRIVEALVEYEAARALYRGDYMTQDLYADWTLPERARYEEMYLALLGHLAHLYSDRHRYDDSIACCRQILARDSFREDAYRQLMRCYSRLGRRNQALCEYKACKEVLRWELGVEPMNETTALYERIVREEPV